MTPLTELMEAGFISSIRAGPGPTPAQGGSLLFMPACAISIPNAGAPACREDVAALVEGWTDDSLTVTFVNVNPSRGAQPDRAGRRLWRASDRFGVRRQDADRRSTRVNFPLRLAPGAGARLTIKMKRFANDPTLSFPWESTIADLGNAPPPQAAQKPVQRIGMTMKTGWIIAAASSAVSLRGAEAAPGDWPSYGHDAGGTRYSPLTQITPANVAQLQPVWTFHMNPAFDPKARQVAAGQLSQDTPLEMGGVLYLATPYSRVVALDAVSGKQIWAYQLPQQDNPAWRGLAWWPGSGKTGPAAVLRHRAGTVDRARRRNRRAVGRLRQRRHRRSQNAGDHERRCRMRLMA